MPGILQKNGLTMPPKHCPLHFSVARVKLAMWSWGQVEKKFSKPLLPLSSAPPSAAQSAAPLAAASLVVLLVGWMSPQYAEELGAFQLKDYLSSSPLSAALVVQSSWALLALVPVKNGTNWCRLPSRTGHTWLLALFLAVLSVATHAMWYKSFTGTTPAINTLVWNLDIVAALVLEALVAWKPPKSSAVLGSFLTLLGAFLAVRSGMAGNTMWGCALCLFATVQYSLCAIMTAELLMDCPLTTLLALEGVMSLFTLLGVLAMTTLLGSPWPVFPSWSATMFMAVANMMLNFGWLSFTVLMGAAQAALAACLSMPISLLLDELLLHSWANPLEAVASHLIRFFEPVSWCGDC
ncbi:unnamed protein product [Durusdinium trenchii]|uniref:EamA domain-containing protein n=1 Tax=Durusdinium trenchii TaxID=1381693 RepID=A0ABP0QFZ8_9DINO